MSNIHDKIDYYIFLLINERVCVCTSEIYGNFIQNCLVSTALIFFSFFFFQCFILRYYVFFTAFCSMLCRCVYFYLFYIHFFFVNKQDKWHHWITEPLTWLFNNLITIFDILFSYDRNTFLFFLYILELNYCLIQIPYSEQIIEKYTSDGSLIRL